LVYGRLTHSEDEETGTGAIPQILIDTALEMKAEPYVVRINVRDVGAAVVFKYWGIEELTKILKNNIPEWQLILLKDRTALDFLRMKENKVNTLSIEISSTPDNLLSLTLKVDGRPLGYVIDVVFLLNSVCSNDEFWIFTCDCGDPGCASIEKGVTVVSQDKYVVWKNYSLKPRRVYLFDEIQYRIEIMTKGKSLVNSLKRGKGHNDRSVYIRDLDDLEKAVWNAEERFERQVALKRDV